MPGTEDALARVRSAAEADGHAFFAVSAVTGEGLEDFTTACAAEVAELRSRIEPTAILPDFNEAVERERQRRDRAVQIRMESRGIWRVSGGLVERMVVQTDWDNDEAIAYLQHRFDRMGLDAKLAAAGCQAGDEVRILGFAFDYEGEGAQDAYDELEEELATSDEEGE